MTGAWHRGLVTDVQDAAALLRDLAADVLRHASCHHCRCSAADALEAVGALGEVLDAGGLDDPRLWCHEQQAEWARRARPPVLRTADGRG